jgi:hypothetical protein
VEVYNNQLKDLIDINTEKKSKHFKPIGRQGTSNYIKAVKSLNLTSKDQALNNYKQSLLKLQTAETAKNKQSSRSHTIVLIESKRIIDKKTSSLLISDLAGSEKSGKSATNSNKSKLLFHKLYINSEET